MVVRDAKRAGARLDTGHVITSTNHYDVAVVGRGIAGPVAAALLARTGRRVAWIHNEPSDSESIDGRRLVTRTPRVLPKTPLIDQTLRTLGLTTYASLLEGGDLDGRKPVHSDIAFVRKSGVSRLSQDIHEVADAIEASNPALAREKLQRAANAFKTINLALDEIIDTAATPAPSGLARFRRRSPHSQKVAELASYATEHVSPLADALPESWFLHASNAARPTTLCRTRLIAALLTGHGLIGDRFSRALEGRVTEFRGDVFEELDALEIIRGGFRLALRAADAISAQAVVWADPTHRKAGAISHDVQLPRPALRDVCVDVRVRSEWELPRGHTFFVAPPRAHSGGPMVRVSSATSPAPTRTSDVETASGPSDQTRTLCVSAALAVDAPPWMGARAHALATLGTLSPFCGRHVVSILTNEDEQGYLDIPHGMVVSRPPHVRTASRAIFHDDREPLAAHPEARSGIFFASPAIYAGLGVEGEFLAAVRAATHLEAVAPLRNRLSRRSAWG